MHFHMDARFLVSVHPSFRNKYFSRFEMTEFSLFMETMQCPVIATSPEQYPEI